MTPQEKAKELMEMYVDVNEFYNNQYNNKVVIRDYNFAKQCALITVDELIIEENKYNNGSFYPSNYWQKVKQEIENL